MRTAIRRLAVLLLLCAAVPVQAVDEPENIVKYRQQVMKALGAHAGAVAARTLMAVRRSIHPSPEQLVRLRAPRTSKCTTGCH